MNESLRQHHRRALGWVMILSQWLEPWMSNAQRKRRQTYRKGGGERKRGHRRTKLSNNQQRPLIAFFSKRKRYEFPRGRWEHNVREISCLKSFIAQILKECWKRKCSERKMVMIPSRSNINITKKTFRNILITNFFFVSRLAKKSSREKFSDRRRLQMSMHVPSNGRHWKSQIQKKTLYHRDQRQHMEEDEQKFGTFPAFTQALFTGC